jgi:hypothetical protein
VAPSHLPKMVDADVKREKQRLKSTGQRIYRTTHVVQSAVVSTPITPAAYETDPMLRSQVDAFFADAVAYLRAYVEQRGGDLVSVVMHLDENYVHLHTFALPRHVPGYRARELDPAGAAAEAMRRDGLTKDQKEVAASAACEGFRRDFGEKVGVPHGLAVPEPNPETRRKSRRELKAERRRVASVAEVPEVTDSLEPDTASSPDPLNVVDPARVSDPERTADSDPDPLREAITAASSAPDPDRPWNPGAEPDPAPPGDALEEAHLTPVCDPDPEPEFRREQTHRSDPAADPPDAPDPDPRSPCPL